MGEHILVNTGSLLQQKLHSFVSAMQESGISVHIQEAIEVFCIVVLDTPDVEVKQLVTLCNVLCSQLVEVDNAEQASRPNCVPVLSDLLVDGGIEEVRDHVKNPLVLVRPNDEFNFCVELPRLQQLLRFCREEGVRGEGRIRNSLDQRSQSFKHT